MFELLRGLLVKMLVGMMLVCAGLSVALPAMSAYSDTVKPVAQEAKYLDNNQALGSLLKGCSNSTVGANLLLTCTRDIMNIILVVAILILIIRIAATQLGTVFSAGDVSGGPGPVVATRNAIRDGLLGVILLGGAVLILNIFNTSITSNFGYQGKVSAQVISLCREAIETTDTGKIKRNVTTLKQLIKDKKTNDDEKIYIGGANCSQQLVKTKKLTQKIVMGPQKNTATYAIETQKNTVNAVQTGIIVVPVTPPDTNPVFTPSESPVCGRQSGACGPGDQCANVSNSPYSDPEFPYQCLEAKVGSGSNCGGNTNGTCPDPTQICTPVANPSNLAKTPETANRCVNVVNCTTGFTSVCGSNGLNQCVLLDPTNNCDPRCTGDKKCIGSGSVNTAVFSCQCVGTKTNSDCGAGQEAFDSNGGGCADSCRPIDKNAGIAYQCKNAPSCGQSTYGQCTNPNQLCNGTPNPTNPSIINYSCQDKTIDPTAGDVQNALSTCESDPNDETQVHCSVSDLIAEVSADDVLPRVAAAFVPVIEEMNIRNTDNEGARLLLGEITNRLVVNSVQKHMNDASGGSKQILNVARSVVVNSSFDLQSEKMKPVHEKVVRKINSGVAKVIATKNRDTEITPFLVSYTSGEIQSKTVSYLTRNDHLVQVASAIKSTSFNDGRVKALSYRVFNELSRSFINDTNSNSQDVSTTPLDMQRALQDIHADFIAGVTSETLTSEQSQLADEVSQGAMTSLTLLANSANKINASDSAENLTQKTTDFAQAAIRSQNACGSNCGLNNISGRAAEMALRGAAAGVAVAVPGKEAYKKGVAATKQIITTGRPKTDQAMAGSFALAGSTITKMNQTGDAETVGVAKDTLAYITASIGVAQAANVGAAEGVKIITKIFETPVNRDYVKDQKPTFVLQNDVAEAAISTLRQVADSTTQNKMVATEAIQAALAGAAYFDQSKDSAQTSQFNGVAISVLQRAFEVVKVCDTTGGEACANGLTDREFIAGAVKNANKILELKYVPKSDLTQIATILTLYINNISADELRARDVAKELFVYADQVLIKSNIGDGNKGENLKPLANAMLRLSNKLVKQLKNCEDILNNNPNYPSKGACQTTKELTLDMLNISGQYARKIDGLDTGPLTEYTNFFTKTVGVSNAPGYVFSLSGLNMLGAIAEGQKSWTGRGDIATFASQTMEIAAKDRTVDGTSAFVGVLRLAEGVGAGGNNIGSIAQNLTSIVSKIDSTKLTPQYAAEILNASAGLTYGSVKGGGDLGTLLTTQVRLITAGQKDTETINPYRMIQALSVSGVAQKKIEDMASIDDFSLMLAAAKNNLTDTFLGGNKQLFDDLGKNLGSIKWEEVTASANGTADGEEWLRPTGVATAEGLAAIINKADFKSIKELGQFAVPVQIAAGGVTLALAGLPADVIGGQVALDVIDAMGSVPWREMTVSYVGVIQKCQTTEACVGQMVSTTLGKLDTFGLALGLDKNVTATTKRIINGVQQVMSVLLTMDLKTMTRQGADYLFGFLAGIDLSKYLSPEVEKGLKHILMDLPQEIFSGNFSLKFLDNYTYLVNFALRDLVLAVPELQKIAAFYTKVSTWISSAAAGALDLIQTVKDIIAKLKAFTDALPITEDEKTELKRVFGIVKQLIGEIQNAIQSFRAYLVELDKTVKPVIG